MALMAAVSCSRRSNMVKWPQQVPVSTNFVPRTDGPRPRLALAWALPVSLSRSRRAGETGRVMMLPGALLGSLAGIVGEPHVLTGDATAGFAVDWTGRFRGHTPAV